MKVVCRTDEALYDIASPLFETEDGKGALAAAAKAFKAGTPRPPFQYTGR